jgi:phosphoribosylformylglycinamidine cyclo-ligase
MTGTTYKDSGVDIEAGNRAAALMAEAVRSTHGPAVLAGMGAFGGCFDVGAATGAGPVLVASTDGVGTKTMVAAAVGRFDTVGQDLVNHCANDILVQGARPLFFLDYVAAAKLDPQQVAEIVGGVAQACRALGCALLGGETAEMPGVYAEGAFDLAGTIVGAVERDQMLPRPDVQAGDVLLALPSNGLHTNGYSLARHALQDTNYDERPAELGGQSVGEALLAVHRSYVHEVTALRAAAPLKALAHITGGGVLDNLPRALPQGLGAVIRKGSWPVPPIFGLLLRLGNIPERDAYHAFNMGIGMLAVVPPEAVAAARSALPEACVVGEVVAGEGVQIV